MLLTITYEGENSADIGYLLYKNPGRPQVFELTFGKAYVFYPEVSDSKTTAAMLVSIDPLDLAKGKEGSSAGGLFDYVNDRPYAASSFMSVAIAKVFGTAMTGRADSRQALSDSRLNLTATVSMLPCRSQKNMIDLLFEPLGYEVSYETFEVDEKFPSWGESRYVNLALKGSVRLRDLLSHLYVLIPVFDRQKHYWVGREEVEKLLHHGAEWLKEHPKKEYITARYLNNKRSLFNLAFSRLAETDEKEEGEDSRDYPVEKKADLNDVRLESVVAAVKSCGAKSVIDIGCGEGNLLDLLIKEKWIEKIAGADVSNTSLERAKEKLKYNYMSETVKNRINIFQGSLTYRDPRFYGYDAACVIEVIEHLDAARLYAFERVLFEYAKPKRVILTTPNKEYNILYENLSEGELRHGDHRFEWTRAEFRAWAEKTAARFNYEVKFSDVGTAGGKYGAPTQMGVFTLCE